MGDEQFFFALYGHPYKSMDHTIRSGIFRSDGQLLKCDGTPTDLNLYVDDGKVIDLSELEPVYQAPADTAYSSRLPAFPSAFGSALRALAPGLRTLKTAQVAPLRSA